MGIVRGSVFVSHEIPLGTGWMCFLFGGISEFKSSYHFVLPQGLFQGIADGVVPADYDSVKPWDLPVRWVSATLLV